MRRLAHLAKQTLRGTVSPVIEPVLTRQSALTPAAAWAACKIAPSVSPTAFESRSISALPELLPSKHDTDPEQHFSDQAPQHEESKESEAANHRRLSEMQGAASRQKLSRLKMQLPSSEETLERLQSHNNTSCSGQSLPERPALHWREVVEGLRQQNEQTDLRGERMLTDTFGCVSPPSIHRAVPACALIPRSVISISSISTNLNPHT